MRWPKKDTMLLASHFGGFARLTWSSLSRYPPAGCPSLSTDGDGGGGAGRREASRGGRGREGRAAGARGVRAPDAPELAELLGEVLGGPVADDLERHLGAVVVGEDEVGNEQAPPGPGDRAPPPGPAASGEPKAAGTGTRERRPSPPESEKTSGRQPFRSAMSAVSRQPRAWTRAARNLAKSTP